MPQRKVPLVHLEVVLAPGGDHDPLHLRGLTALASGLLDEGTKEHSALELADEAELLGAALYTSGDWDAVYVGASALAQHLPRVFELVAETVRSPTFPPDELERLRRTRLADLANRSSRASFVAGRAAAQMLYGSDHPYGASFVGTQEGLTAIAKPDIEAWYAKRAHPRGTTLIAVGDTDLAEISRLAEHAFGDWPATAPALDSGRSFADSRQPFQMRVVDRPDGVQTELRIVRQGPRRNDPSYLGCRLLSLALAGKFTSRLNLNLRERLGITYGVHSQLGGRRGPGPFSISCAVDTEATGRAVSEILQEFERLRNAPLPAEEIADAKNYLLGTFPYRLQTVEGMLNHLAEIAIYNLDDDTFDRFPAAVEAVTEEALYACAQNLLRSDDLTIVAVGPADSLLPQLEALGEVEVHSEDGV